VDLKRKHAPKQRQTGDVPTFEVVVMVALKIAVSMDMELYYWYKWNQVSEDHTASIIVVGGLIMSCIIVVFGR
jgi:hypothetical protein